MKKIFYVDAVMSGGEELPSDFHLTNRATSSGAFKEREFKRVARLAADWF